jgi:hypothetical protein
MSLEDFTEESLRYFKEKGFSDKAISRFVGCTPPDIYKLRQKFDIMPI